MLLITQLHSLSALWNPCDVVSEAALCNGPEHLKMGPEELNRNADSQAVSLLDHSLQF